MPINYVLSSGLNVNIARLPISSVAFSVQGLDVTIFHHLSVPLLRQFPPKLEISLRIIRHLCNHRGLSYFVLVCATRSTVTHLVVYVDPLMAIFDHWYISACVINTVFLVDAIASFRLVIVGKFVTDLPTSKLCLSPVTSEHTSTIRTHIDSLINENCFNIARIPSV